MQINLEHDNTIHIVQRFKDNTVTINHVDYHHNLIMTPSTIIPNWCDVDFSELTEQNFDEVIKLKPEVFLLSCGNKQQHLAAPLLAIFIQHGIGIEVMTTTAACKTYNILASEGRNVAAALFVQ